MVAYAHNCNEHRLRRHLSGMLADDEQDELASHLDVCEACRNVLDELATDGQSWGSFGEFLGANGEASRRPDRISRQTGADPSSAQAVGDDDDRDASILNLLDPPSDSATWVAWGHTTCSRSWDAVEWASS